MEQLILKLNKFSQYANHELFAELFEEHQTHLWNKFRFKCSYDPVCFYMMLDSENREALIEYLNNLEI